MIGSIHQEAARNGSHRCTYTVFFRILSSQCGSAAYQDSQGRRHISGTDAAPWLSSSQSIWRTGDILSLYVSFTSLFGRLFSRDQSVDDECQAFMAHVSPRGGLEASGVVKTVLVHLNTLLRTH